MSKNKHLEAKFGSPDKPLVINNVEIPCYVLQNGKRVIVQRGLFLALGIKQGGTTNEKYKEYGGAARLVQFLDQNRLISLIDSDIRVLLKSPIIFKLNNVDHYGYEATMLQEIVRAISKAYLKGNLPERYLELGANAEIMDDAFAKVGIIALVDEVTGYQEVRKRDELHKILEAYISPTLLPWTKKFPDEFYKEMFRLNGWIYNPGTVKRPGVIGTWTNKYIYEQLPKGVLDELKSKQPKSDAGNYTKRLHQGLTNDIGNPHLNNQLAVVTAIMKISPNWRKFISNFARAFNLGEQESDENSEE